MDLLTSDARPCSACGLSHGFRKDTAAGAGEATKGTAGEGVPRPAGGPNSSLVTGEGVVPPGSIVCDSCGAAYHLSCLRSLTREVPRCAWFCPTCVSPPRDMWGLGSSPRSPLRSTLVSQERARVKEAAAGDVGRTAPAGLVRPPPPGGFGCWSRYSAALCSSTGGDGGKTAGGNGCLLGANGKSVVGGAGGDELGVCVGNVGPVNGSREPPLLSGSGAGGSLEVDAGEEGLGMRGITQWGPSPGIPKALDWSLSWQTRNCLEMS